MKSSFVPSSKESQTSNKQFTMSSIDNKKSIQLHANIKQEPVLDSSVNILDELMRQLKKDPPVYQSKEVRSSIQVRVDADGKYAECIETSKQNAALAAATKLIFAIVGDEIIKELTAPKKVTIDEKDFVSILDIQSAKFTIAKPKYIKMKTKKRLKDDVDQVFTIMCIYNDKRSEGTGRNIKTAKQRAAAAMIQEHGKKVVV